jgi:hypothetical protein
MRTDSIEGNSLPTFALNRYSVSAFSADLICTVFGASEARDVAPV